MRLRHLLILPLLVASLQAASVDDLTFTLQAGGTEYSLSDCDESASGSLDIPSTYNDLPVTSIGDRVFTNCSSLTSITIPDSVTSIGGYAFQYCSNLSSITIPDSVTSIGDGVFSYCTSLRSVTIGNSVTSIGVNAFRDCISLTSITIPDSVTSIVDYAFYKCSSLSSITIGNSVTSIGFSAFNGCSGLNSITFEGPPPAFEIATLTDTNSEPILYYKAFPQMYSVYKETYNLPLVYLGPPTINVQPQGAIASIGEAVNLSVSATDVESSQLSYQWMRNGIDLVGETAAALSITSITSTDGGIYQVKVSNTEGTTTSEAASLTLLASDLYTQQQFDTALSSGFALGVITVQENAANYGLVAEENIEDGRAGSSSIQVTNGTATLQLQIERSEDLNNWTSHQDDLISVPLQLNGDSQFFRFKMTE